MSYIVYYIDEKNEVSVYSWILFQDSYNDNRAEIVKYYVYLIVLYAFYDQ